MRLGPMHLTCACGQFHLEVSGPPIISAECHCESCRTAAVRLGALPDVVPLQAPNGGTRYVLYRKDRVAFPDGTENLKQFYLTPKSPTRRVLTACCNTPVFLEFKSGHWLSLYGHLWTKETLPPPELRTMTGDLPKTVTLDGTVPAGGLPTARFYVRLLAAWIAMGFRVPAISIAGTVDA